MRKKKRQQQQQKTRKGKMTHLTLSITPERRASRDGLLPRSAAAAAAAAAAARRNFALRRQGRRVRRTAHAVAAAPPPVGFRHVGATRTGRNFGRRNFGLLSAGRQAGHVGDGLRHGGIRRWRGVVGQ